VSVKMNDGGPAFPACHPNAPETHGMSLRDYFAGQALTGIWANQSYDVADYHTQALHAYKAADAMLAARKGGQ
jgi:uncharacterized protein YjlB